MNRKSTNLKTFLALSVGTFLLLLLINIALPGLFLLFQVPSFAIGSEQFWLLRWQNDANESRIQFNLLPILTIAILVALIGAFMKKR